jgi:Kef-type K+ transport system membrane component KefB
LVAKFRFDTAENEPRKEKLAALLRAPAVTFLRGQVTGFQWELAVDIALVFLPLMAAWRYMHQVPLPSSWPYRSLYSVLVMLFCETLYFVSKYHLHMEPVHLEVLLPAFVIGCLLKEDHGAPPSKMESRVATGVSAVFMLCVGLSTPPLALSGERSVLTANMAGHVAVVTVLMIFGKMFPVICYRDEADWQTRFALSLGMCPRGEVGAGIIVISIESGIKGFAIELAVVCLAINLVLSGAFVTWTKRLASASELRRAIAAEDRRKSRASRAERLTKNRNSKEVKQTHEKLDHGKPKEKLGFGEHQENGDVQYFADVQFADLEFADLPNTPMIVNDA